MISAPSQTAYTNATVEVQVALTGATPEMLELLVDGASYARIVDSGHYTWNTTDIAEGSHTLVARATIYGEKRDSEPRVVVVDRTSPTVETRAPMPGATNVFMDDPFIITFSEALLPSSVGGSVSVSSQSQPISSTVTLSEDGMTLTIGLPNLTVFPNTISASLAASLKDLAGNALGPVDWSFQLPIWVVVGGKDVNPVAGQHIVDLNSANDVGDPLIVVVESDGTRLNASVLQWTGSAWNQLGSSVNADPLFNVTSPVVSRNRIGPVLAFAESDGAHLNTYAYQWNGNEWVQLGGTLNAVAGGDVNGGAIQGYGAGDVFSAFFQSGGGALNDYAYKWSGSTWQPLGAAWNPVGAPPQGVVARPALRASSAGTPFIATRGSDGNVYVAQWTAGAWQAVGGAVNPVPGQLSQLNVSLALTKADRPVLAFAQTDGAPAPVSNAYVMQWSGAAWVQRGSAINPAPGQNVGMNSRSLLLDSNDVPYVLVSQPNAAGTLKGHVQRLVGTNWVPLGGPLDTGSGLTYASGSLMLDLKGRPIVAIRETDGVSSFAYVLRANLP
ncbi:MAG: Ig-like domain-containing protein [Myxococcales bacterium]